MDIINAYVIPGIRIDSYMPDEKRLAFIKSIVCKEFGFEWEELIERNKAGRKPLARFFFMYFAKRYTNLSLKEIGMYMASKNRRKGFDHTSVLHGINQIKGKIDPKIQDKLTLHYYQLIKPQLWI